MRRVFRWWNNAVLQGELNRRSHTLFSVRNLNKTISLPTLLILTLPVSTVAAQLPVDQNGGTLPFASGMGIVSPTNGATYTSGYVTLNVSQTIMAAANIHYSLVYSLDGQANDSVPLTTKSAYEGSMFQEFLSGTVNLPSLSDGAHRITVYETIDVETSSPQHGTAQDTVYFTVDKNVPPDTLPPVISNLKMKNRTFWSGEMVAFVSFNLNETVSWIGYCLDDQSNVTVAGFYDPAIWGTQFNASWRARFPPVSPNLSDIARGYLQNVLPLNLSAYNVSALEPYTLPSGPADAYVTQAAEFNLTAADSILYVHFTFADTSPYELVVQVENGNIHYAEHYGNMTEVARSVLQNYGAYTGTDFSVFINLLPLVDENQNMNAATGNVTLGVGHMGIPLQMKLTDHFEPVGNATLQATIFTWTIGEGNDTQTVSIDFNDCTFHSLRDNRILFQILTNNTTADNSTAANPTAEPTPSPTTQPSQTVTPTASQAPTPSQTPTASTQTPQTQTQSLPQQAALGAGFAAAIGAVAAMVLFLKKRRQNQTSLPF
jgi:hypothetical protein